MTDNSNLYSYKNVDFKKVINNNIYSKSEKEKIISKVDDFISSLNSVLKENDVVATAVLGGSSAKGTFLKGNFDCDVFVRFDYKNYSKKNESLSDILEPIIFKITNSTKSNKNYDRVHGSRDYFQFTLDSIFYEIIPVLLIKKLSDAKNITDSSPLHVEWIKSVINKNPSVVDQIVLTKIFMKANRLYGAESFINGFSGHDIDILISYYGSFINLLSASQSWKKYEVVDVENHYKKVVDKNKIKNMINESKVSPLILIDPIQKERNAAASLSDHKFNSFINIAKLFLEKPSLSFFVKTKIDLNYLKKKLLGLVKGYKNSDVGLLVIDATPKIGKTDVIGAKLLKSLEYIEKQARINGFSVYEFGWDWDKKNSAIFWFYYDTTKLSKTFEKMGPPINSKVHVDSFRKKNIDVFERGNRLYANVKRKYVLFEEFCQYIINDKYINEKVTKISISDNIHNN
jgi:tRNA nucleotidyltransferase (CCA-adding enzyme)